MPRDTKPEWVEGCSDCRDLEQRWRAAGTDMSAHADIRMLTARHRHVDHPAARGTAPLTVGPAPERAVEK